MLSKSLRKRISIYKRGSFQPVRKLDLAEFRENSLEHYQDFSADYPGVISRDNALKTTEGATINYREYTYCQSERSQCIFYVFAGGFIKGNLDSQNNICRYIASHCKCNVIALAYRLAPENKYPAAHNDIYKGIYALVTQKTAYTSFCLVGYSSGGNLALSAINRLIRHSNIEVVSKIKTLALVAPFINLAQTTGNQIDNVMLDVEDLLYMAKLYADETVDLKSPLISPYYEENTILAKLPETVIISMAQDPLAADAYNFYRKILSLGVESEFHEYNMIHLEFALSTRILSNPLEMLCAKLVKH